MINDPYHDKEQRRDAIIARFLAHNCDSIVMKILFLSRFGIIIQITVISFVLSLFLSADDVALTVKLVVGAVALWLLPSYADHIGRTYDLGNKLIAAGKMAPLP